ncbi:CHEK2 [Bugula neritina]|uniref:CHEK2 n=1 Tax=Bugula neritina TaxID=10212 RepID=A0A7J7JZH1_BUGNE|nr:CHEK2 [Bugula neritina]
MSSDETRTPSSTGPSTGSSSKQSGDQSHSSSQSQASTFDTQPPSSQEPSDTISQAWGQLAVIGSSTCYELIKNEYKIGRGKDCDIILRNNERPTLTSTLWKACSKQHFLIYMENKRSGRYIFLKDLSSNGTVVNEDFIGSGKFTVISSGDVISLVDKDHKVPQNI